MCPTNTYNTKIIMRLSCDLFPAAELEGAEEEEDSSSDDDDFPVMCEDGTHVWSHDVCMVCMFCGFCTGYGPGCCNEGSPNRDPGRYVIKGCISTFFLVTIQS